MHTDFPASYLLSLEQQRCDAIVNEDWERLRSLLSERLVHTHTRGNTDSRESYLAYISGIIQSLELRRENLQVIPLGIDVAVMHGKQINRARRRGDAREVVVEATVTQVWHREDKDHWRMVAFHASPLGEPPPAVPR